MKTDFTQLIEMARGPRKGCGDLSILAGLCPEKEILQFLAQWDLRGMPYRIWEYVSTIEFKQDNSLPYNIVLLERGRIFGVDGDLSLRRNDSGFEWCFIGPRGVRPPEGAFFVQDYWKDHSNICFLEYKKTALLWGEFHGERWVESRVAAAQLDYPHKGKRVALVYKAFSRAGQVEFVWYTGLKEWEGSSNG